VEKRPQTNREKFDQALEKVMAQLAHVEADNGEIVEMSVFDAIARELAQLALHASDAKVRADIGKYLMDKQTGRAAQSTGQGAAVDDLDPLDGVSDEDQRRILELARNSIG
jgi:hypothetical protein